MVLGTGVGLLALGDAALLAVSVPRIFDPVVATDWSALVEGSRRISGGLDPYLSPATAGGFVWSPVAAWLMVPLSLIGLWGWRVLHLLAALAMPTTRLRLATLAWWAFWIDAAFGNIMVFALLLAAWSVTGRRWAQLGFVALVCLAPKPIFLPFVLWLLLANPDLRLPAGEIILVNAGLIALVGHGQAWLLTLAQRGAELANVINLSPSALVGGWWIPVGLVLAVVLYRRRLFGLAGLALSPYWLPYYFLMPVLDLPRPIQPKRAPVSESLDSP